MTELNLISGKRLAKLIEERFGVVENLNDFKRYLEIRSYKSARINFLALEKRERHRDNETGYSFILGEKVVDRFEIFLSDLIAHFNSSGRYAEKSFLDNQYQLAGFSWRRE